MVTLIGLGVFTSFVGSDDDVAGEARRRRREAQLHGAARERLLRAFPGKETSEGNTGDDELLLSLLVEMVAAEEEVSVVALAVAAEEAEGALKFVVGEMR